MRFGVLGPLEVWTAEGRPVRVPEAKVRALLANLLVYEGKPVSVGRLLDDLWGARQPGNPTNTLQTKVSQLRRVLEEAEPGARDLVVYRPPGYLLRVGPDDVDAGRFRAMLAHARQTEDLRARASLLADALALWRGPALADFDDEPFAATAIKRLAEERLVAMEEHAETRLELGQHSELAVDLADPVARHPLRERLRAVHLRALYRAGRQTEALASFAEVRDLLADELGLDPGPELVAVHQAILTQDTALDVPATPARPRTNLPVAVTGLVGRQAQLRRLCSLLGTARLVTLTGPGGVGKTSLAFEAARQLADTCPDGAWLVELATVNKSGDADVAWAVEQAVLAALGIRENAGGGPLGALAPAEPGDRLVDALRAKRMLLVLDNCEPVVGTVAALARRLLEAAPGLRILATSQQVLALRGETVVPVPPLDLPAAHEETEFDTVRASSAVRLFELRAAAAAPGFAMDEGNARAVAVICRRLDGIPLALELAATRVRVLDVHELESRLDDRFGLLTSGQRDAPGRQQTLRAILDWSWELLSEAERVVLRRLAVHVDGCTLTAAETVCSGDGVEPVQVLDLLARLVDRSLVVVIDEPHTGDRRYRLLESVSAYCLERLREVGELERLRQRHSQYYIAFAERAEPHLRGHDQLRWLRRLDTDAANTRDALDTAIRRADGRSALRLVNAMVWYWFLRGRLSEASRSMAAALSVGGDGSSAIRAKAETWHAGLGLLVGAGAGRDGVDSNCVTRWRDIDDRTDRARVRWFLNYARTTIADMRGSEITAEELLAEFGSLGDRWGMAAVLSDWAHQRINRGDFAAAERDALRADDLFAELGDRWGRVQASFVLGSLAEITGDYERAACQHREGLRMAEEIGLWAEVSYQLSWLGRIALLTRDYTRARELHGRAMRLAVEQGFAAGEMYAETGLALGARREGEFDVAERHLRRVREWHCLVEFEPGNTLILAELGFLAEQRGDAATARNRHLDAFAIARRFGDPRAIALTLEGLAGAEALARRHRNAARLLGAAWAARDSVGAPLPGAERIDVDRATDAARKALGDAVFAAEFDHGRRLTPEECHSLIA